MANSRDDVPLLSSEEDNDGFDGEPTGLLMYPCPDIDPFHDTRFDKEDTTFDHKLPHCHLHPCIPHHHHEDQMSFQESCESARSNSDFGRDDVEAAKNYEGLDYDIIENTLYFKEEASMSALTLKSITIWRWLICICIGALTGLLAFCINVAIIELSNKKMEVISEAIQRCVENGCLHEPMLIWIGLNVAAVLIASSITIFTPVAAGSGIPQIKCFLNGVKIPMVVRLRTLATKSVGIVLAVVGGLAVGKEGPMIHSGAVIAAGISQGQSFTVRSIRLGGLFPYFRNDHEKRDFVCAGAAAGVSAAFGAPVGGVLFSLEEAASFWNQGLTWRVFLCSIVSTYTLNMAMSIYRGHPADLAYPGLINFGKFEGTYIGAEIFIFILMAVFGGLSGALFVSLNHKISVFRRKYQKRWFFQVQEAVIVAIISGTIAFVWMYIFSAYDVASCKPLGQDPHVKLQFMCGDGLYNSVAALVFTTPEESVKSLFHDPFGSFSPAAVSVFVVAYFLLACWTYGLVVPSGLFIPSLLIGAAWGRLVGMLIASLAPEDALWAQDIAKYALMGAAAQLGGTVRMTISLAVILIEATGNITYSFPLMVVLLVAKLVGDLFNTGIYDMHVHLACVPLIEWEPPPFSSLVFASDIMSSPPTTLLEVSKVGDISRVFEDPQRRHSGFPVVSRDGKFRGFILKSQLLVLLKYKAFIERRAGPEWEITLSKFRDTYPKVVYVNVSSDEKRFCHMDLRPYVNPSPYTIFEHAAFPRIFRLFRALGLRHVTVVNDNYQVVGIITRKDIWKLERILKKRYRQQLIREIKEKVFCS